MKVRLVLALSLACALGPARADDVLLGAGVRARPAYDGAAQRRADLVPLLRYYGAPWFARTTQGLLEGGARADLAPGLALGAQLAWEGGRVRAESPFLEAHQAENIAPGVSLGMHLEWDVQLGPMPVSTLLRWRAHTRAALGAQTDLRVTAGVVGGERFKAAAFAQATWADAKSAAAYYGVSAAQSAATGLPAHGASAGLLYTAAGLLWSYDFTLEWLLTGSLEARRLRGDARASPLVEDAANEYASVGLARRF